MRFSYAESMCDPAQYVPLALALDQSGWDGFIVPDSIAYPEVSDSKYPYTPDGSREFLDGKPFIEPFALIPALGAVTERLRFTTFVVKLPIRQPVLVAKQAASVAVLTGNRFGFGVGLSPWPEDFAITGTGWKTRGRRMDEMIEIIRGLTAPGDPAPPTPGETGPPAHTVGRYFSYQGKHYQIPSIKISPTPSQPIPILVGGHAEPALRRAAELGDGWMHAGGDAEALARCLARLRELRAASSRAQEPFEVHVISLDAYTVDGIKRLEDQGVTDVIVGFRNSYETDTQPLQQKLDVLRGYADNVIHKLGGSR